jgi:oxygen-independent coproporphyrinogen-3 oxidase
MLGLYIHIPFCAAICNYCNFNRGLLDDSLKSRYVAALLRELRASAGRYPAADTLYFGGGTPSLLEPLEVRSIIETSRAELGLTEDAEITLEANPETIDPERLDGFRQAGVNRLSFGVQSFHDDELRRLGRLHSAARAMEALGLARAAGFDNLSLDLMMWLPEQTVTRWLESVERAIEVGPEHLSLYILELYPNAPLRDDMARGGWTQAPDEVAADMYEESMERLDEAGYEQYEISNVAKPGRRSRHNVKYWLDGEWVGFGCGAHSTYGGSRWRNVSATEDYVARVSTGADVVVERILSDRDTRLGEALITGLRLTEGVEVSRLAARYGVDIWQRYGDHLGRYAEAGLLVKDGDRVRLSRRGMLLSHEVMAVFV